jgi:hypothetical protein
MGWATFWATFWQSHLVTLAVAATLSDADDNDLGISSAALFAHRSLELSKDFYASMRLAVLWRRTTTSDCLCAKKISDIFHFLPRAGNIVLEKRRRLSG